MDQDLGRFVEVLQIDPFDRQTAKVVGDRMVTIMSVLQPLIEEAEIPAGNRATATGGGFWRRRRGT